MKKNWKNKDLWEIWKKLRTLNTFSKLGWTPRFNTFSQKIYYKCICHEELEWRFLCPLGSAMINHDLGGSAVKFLMIQHEQLYRKCGLFLGSIHLRTYLCLMKAISFILLLLRPWLLTLIPENFYYRSKDRNFFFNAGCIQDRRKKLFALLSTCFCRPPKMIIRFNLACTQQVGKPFFNLWRGNLLLEVTANQKKIDFHNPATAVVYPASLESDCSGQKNIRVNDDFVETCSQ